jgi:hypothetical protein
VIESFGHTHACTALAYSCCTGVSYCCLLVVWAVRSSTSTYDSCCYRSLVYPGMAPLEHNFRYHSFPSLRESGSPQSSGPEQCGRSRFPKAMRESPLLGHPPQKSQYGAATPQALLGGIFERYLQTAWRTPARAFRLDLPIPTAVCPAIWRCCVHSCAAVLLSTRVQSANLFCPVGGVSHHQVKSPIWQFRLSPSVLFLGGMTLFQRSSRTLNTQAGRSKTRWWSQNGSTRRRSVKGVR